MRTWGYVAGAFALLLAGPLLAVGTRRYVTYLDPGSGRTLVGWVLRDGSVCGYSPGSGALLAVEADEVTDRRDFPSRGEAVAAAERANAALSRPRTGPTGNL